MNNNLKKGLFFGILGDLLVGFQPIVANARPDSLDAYIFAALTCLIEATLFLPFIFIELKINKSKMQKNGMTFSESNSTLKNWKKNLWLLIFIGVLFGINQFLFFIGYKLAGAINGSLTQKTTVFFGLIFGFVILKEKITKIQILFSCILFFGLILAMTQGSFDLLIFNVEVLIGVFILLLITCLWMFGHTMTKPIFNRNEATPTQMVFLRNVLSGILLFSTYFLFFPIENFYLLFDPINQFYYISMGIVYGLGLFCWYKTLSYLDVSKATILFSPTPIVTALFATILLGVVFTIYHLIGILIIIISIIVIVRIKEN